MVSFRVLELFKGGGCRSDTKELEYPCLEQLPPICYVFLDTQKDSTAFPRDEASRARFLRDFEIPSLLLSKACIDGNGYFGCNASHSDEGKLLSCNLWFQALVKLVEPSPSYNENQYQWYEMAFFTRWALGSCVVLCIGTPAEMLSKLEVAFSKKPLWNPLNFADPFAMYIPLIDEIVKLHDKAVWGLRDMIRPIAKYREKENNFEIDFSLLQTISRHSIHVGEVLSALVDTTEEMKQQRQVLLLAISEDHNTQQLNWDKTGSCLDFQRHILKNLKTRQQSNEDRFVQGEITLAFNTMTQRDSKILRDDSRTMKTVAILTIIFLPATFTSSVFGMNFFNFTPGGNGQPQRWTSSNKLWIFWLVSATLTAATMAVWLSWQHRLKVTKYTRREVWRTAVKDVEKGF